MKTIKKTSQRKPAKQGSKLVSVEKKKKHSTRKRPNRVGEVHKRGMSDRAWKFCHELVRIGIKEKAAISAGYSEKTAASQATRLLKNEKVVEKVNELRVKLSKKMEISAESVLKEFSKIGFTDLTDLVDMSDGFPRFKNLEAIDPKYLSALQSVSVGKSGIKFKMHDKKGALEALAKHLNLFKDDNKREVEVKIGDIKTKDVKKVKDIFDEITE